MTSQRPGPLEAPEPQEPPEHHPPPGGRLWVLWRGLQQAAPVSTA